MHRTRLVWLAVFTCISLVATACAQVPEGGPVEEVTLGAGDQEQQVAFAPLEPQHGASPAEIVGGYLDAMGALITDPLAVGASKFLTEEAAERWNPEQGTRIYATQPHPHTLTTDRVQVSAKLTARLSTHGEWSIVPENRQRLRHVFALERERGEWRIGNPPQGRLISEHDFEDFEPYSLYFIDPTYQVLVPARIYLPPASEQTATLLLRGLMRGPTRWLRGAAASMVPATSAVEPAVSVDGAGVAEVRLGPEVKALSTQDRERLAAQLAWTLRQDSDVTALRVLSGETPIQLTSSQLVGVDEFSEFDPADSPASPALYVLQRGVLTTVSEDGENVTPVPGPFGSGDYLLQSYAVDRAGARAVGVVRGGTYLYRAPLAPANDPPTVILQSAGRIADVQYDFHDQVWALERIKAGFALSVFDANRWHQVALSRDAPADIRAFSVSRDGSRFAAVDGAGGDARVMVGRIVRSADGSGQVSIDRWYELQNAAEPLQAPIDVGWSSPTELAVVALAPVGSHQLYTISIDGAVVEDSVLAGYGVRSVAASPSANVPTVVGTGTPFLHVLGARDWGLRASGASRLLKPAYVE